MRIKINLTKKQIIPIISAVIILIGIIFVYAQSSPNPGHSINEIGGIPDCTSSQSLTHNSTGWFCVSSDSIGAGVNNLNVSGQTFAGYLMNISNRYLVKGWNNPYYLLYSYCPQGTTGLSCNIKGWYGYGPFEHSKAYLSPNKDYCICVVSSGRDLQGSGYIYCYATCTKIS